MRQNRSMTQWSTLFLTAVFLFIAACPLGVSAAERTVKVAYPVQTGFTEVSEGNALSGYTYDYLTEIARYTHWNYEFVRVEGDENQQIGTLYDMLLRGEVDLMGGMIYNENTAKKMDFASHNYGTSYIALCVLESNAEITSENYYLKDPLRVAVFKGAESFTKSLEEFAEISGIHLEKVVFEEANDGFAALESGGADAILLSDVSQEARQMRIVARFSPRPFYFAATKGNTDLINEVNAAIANINETNPYFNAELQEKYFGTKASELFLTEEEKQYISARGPVRVCGMGGKAPVQSLAPKTGEARGVTKNILDYITEQTGLQFQLEITDDYEAYEQAVRSGTMDLAAGVSKSQELVQEMQFGISVPYITASISLVAGRGVDLGDRTGKRLALSKEARYNGVFDGEVTRFDTAEECLEAVHSGKMDYCYGNSYSVQYYMSDPHMKNLVAVPRTEEWEQDFCFSVLDKNDRYLLSILNKCIQAMPENEIIQDFLFSNAYQPEAVTLLSYIKANPLQAVLVLWVLVLVFVVLLLLWSRQMERKNNLARKLENERYEQISELSNEFLFGYDVLKDQLALPEKSAQFLGCGRVLDHVSVQGNGNDVLRSIVMVKDGSTEQEFALPDGRVCWLRILSKTVRDEHGAPVYKVGKLVDIQQEKERQQQLLERAQRDSMTGLYNAATVRQLVGKRLKENKTGGTFFIVDIDYFKKINDTAGHYIGDLVLQKTADVFGDVFGSGSIAGRLGGDEFIIYREMKDENEIEALCDRLQKSIGQIQYGEQQGQVSLSIGVAAVRRGEAFDEVYQRADQALYEVKKQGRGSYKVVR